MNWSQLRAIAGDEVEATLARLPAPLREKAARLPVTFERRWEDNPVHDNYYPAADSKVVVYKEGVFVGYRGYERNHTKPLFPFGYGLSYTTFAYGNLAVTPAKTKDGRVRVAFDVTNTGSLSIVTPLPTRALRLRGGDTLISDQFNNRVIRVSPSKHIVASYGLPLVGGSGAIGDNVGYDLHTTQKGLYSPYDAKVNGDFTGLTPPFGFGDSGK